MSTESAHRLRSELLSAVHDRATTDAFDFDTELAKILEPLGLIPADSGRFRRNDNDHQL